MAAADWPTSLPTRPLVDGYSETPPNTVVRSNTAVGPAKTRRRATAGVRRITCRYRLTAAQVDTLDTFYWATLESGALRFNWTHPRTSSVYEVRFVSPPSFSADDGDAWLADVELELLP